jgi:hypothetical protein
MTGAGNGRRLYYLIVLQYRRAQEVRPDHYSQYNLPPYQLCITDGEQPANKPYYAESGSTAFHLDIPPFPDYVAGMSCLYRR